MPAFARCATRGGVYLYREKTMLDDETELTEENVQYVLARKLIDKGHKTVSRNSQSTHSEADLVSITSSLYLNEYEIKLNREDFLREMRAYNKEGTQNSKSMRKQRKHRLIRKCLNKGFDHDDYYENTPNKFWMVAPLDTLDIDEIPDYWGLYEFDYWLPGNGTVSIELYKESKAKFIHKNTVTKETLANVGREISSRYWSNY